MAPIARIAYWLPRLLGLGFVALLALLSLDVFAEYSGWIVIVPLLIHLIPAIALLGVVVLAWTYELVGAVAFLGFALLYVWDIGLDRPWSIYAGVVAPATAVGIMFFVSWMLGLRVMREE